LGQLESTSYFGTPGALRRSACVWSVQTVSPMAQVKSAAPAQKNGSARMTSPFGVRHAEPVDDRCIPIPTPRPAATRDLGRYDGKA